MVIRKAQEKDFVKLAKIYSTFFPTHNIFQKSKKEIATYLRKQSKIDDLLVLDDKGVLKGALYLVNFGQNADGSHKLWKIRHFAFQNKGAFSALVDEAEKRIRKVSATAKIELTIAKNEKGQKLFQAKGYKKEAALVNHYRWGETCSIFGKSFSNR